MTREDDFGNVYDDDPDVQITDPYGNPIIEGTTKEFASTPYLRSEWMRGTANGDFAVGPPDPDKPLNSDESSLDYNPLPGWAVVDDSNQTIKAYWTPDAAVGSGAYIKFTCAPNAPGGGSLYLVQNVPVRNTPTRNVVAIPMASLISLTGAAPFRHSLHLQAEEFQADGDSNGLMIDASFDSFAVSGGYVDMYEAAVDNLNASTNYVQLRFGVEIDSPSSQLENHAFFECVLLTPPPFTAFPDLTVPTNSPATIRYSNGTLNISATAVAFGGSLNLGGNQILNAGFLELVGAIEMESIVQGSPIVAADTNNWDPWSDAGLPTGESGVLGFLADVTGSTRTITGIRAADIDHGHLLFIGVDRSSAQSLQFSHLSASSTAANRLILPGLTSLTIGPGEGVWFRYDLNDEQRWMVVAVSKVSGAAGAVEQITFDDAVASDYLARIKQSGDTQYRLIAGLDSTGIAELLFGSGSAVGDIQLSRDGPNRIRVKGLLTSGTPETAINIQGPAGQQASIELQETGDSVARLEMTVLAGAPGITFGPGGAGARDVRIYRTGVKELTIDDTAGGAVLIILDGDLQIGDELQVGGAFNALAGVRAHSSLVLDEVAAPGTPAAGEFVVYVKTDGKIYGKNDAGTEHDLTASGGSIDWAEDGDIAAVGTANAANAGTEAAPAGHVHAHEAAHINHDTTWAAKGDLIAGTANDTAAVLPVGAQKGYELYTDSAEATGLKWRNPGYLPFAYPLGMEHNTSQTGTLSLQTVAAGLGGARFMPFYLPAPMLLQEVTVRNTDAASARNAEWALYKQVGVSNTMSRIADGTWSFTPGAASNRSSTASSAPVYLEPGVYWLGIRNTNTSRVFTVGVISGVGTMSMTVSRGSAGGVADQAAFGSTIDLSGLAARDAYVLCRLDGRLGAETDAFYN